MMFSTSLQAVDHAKTKYDLSARFAEDGTTIYQLDAAGVDGGGTVKDDAKIWKCTGIEVRLKVVAQQSQKVGVISLLPFAH